MSLYQSKDDIKTLFGSLETGTPGLLTQSVREKPYAVLLLDELEKAHPDLLNIFLTVIDEGYFTDGYGHRIDCKNLIIIATSNAGSDYIYKQQQILNKINNFAEGGPGGGVSKGADLLDYLIQNRLFSPEFLNRFDGVVQYHPLDPQTALSLARTMADGVSATMYEQYKIHIQISDATLQDMITQGFTPQFGARNLQHVLTQKIEDKVAVLLLEKKAHEGQIIQL
jgi:ATP-dependent Clp protease ATP-binding subunit ClpA